jgi:lipid A 3-O-deacylase
MSTCTWARKRECRVGLLSRSWLVLLCATTFGPALPCCWAEATNLISIRLESAGVRFGLPANNTAHGLEQAEIFSNYDLPWLWPLGGGFEVQSRLDTTAGWIGGHSENAFVGTLGPSLVLRRHHLPLDLDFGSSATLLSVHQWGSVDVGSRFQFTTHAGLDWDITPHVRVGYRFIHMSNAGIAHPNPGLNMHMVGLSVLF